MSEQPDSGAPQQEREVLVERQDLGSGRMLGTVRLHRPDVLNAITPTMLSQGRAAVAELADDDSVAVLRITGSGRAFSAGVDLEILGDGDLEGGAVGSALDDEARGLIQDLETVPKVVIAQINGYCFTGALEIALGCDILVVAREAKLGDTHSRWGLRPTWGMSQRLPRWVGVARARELSYTARTFTGEQALAWGLATHAPALEELDMTVVELAQQVAGNSAGSLAAYKDLYRRSLETGLTEGLRAEAESSYVIEDTARRLREFLD